jgi:hypothetical protein
VNWWAAYSIEITLREPALLLVQSLAESQVGKRRPHDVSAIDSNAWHGNSTG